MAGYHGLSKRRGEEGEVLFTLCAMRQGFTVSRPMGDSARYDAIVDGGGKLSRVQVKITGVIRANGCAVITNKFARSQRYSAAAIDFLAAYAQPFNQWYIIPVAMLRRTLLVKPNGTSAFSQYVEAWHLLRKEPGQ